MPYQFYIGIISFILYHIIIRNKSAKNLLTTQFNENKKSFYWLQATRIIAFILLGLTPLIFAKTANSLSWELIYDWTIIDTWSIIILSIILIPLGAINAKNKEHLKQYPQVKMFRWSRSEFGINILSWGIYLLAYEYLFRGVLFLGILPFIDLTYAIILNTILYSLAHIHKGKKEIIGSIPLGVVFCLITYHTNTIWTAFFVHWIMASNNFIWSHYYSSISSK